MILGVDWGHLRPGSSGGVVQWMEGIFSACIACYPEDKFLMFMPERLPIHFGHSKNVEYYSSRRRTLDTLTAKVAAEVGVDILIRCYPGLSSPDFPTDKQIVIIPDMQHADRPQFFTRKELRRRRLSFGDSLANAAAIGTMTEFSRASITSNPWTNCQDVFLMPPGVRFGTIEVDRAPQPAKWSARVGRFSSFFFMPANLWPHKNHRQLFEAFSRALPALPAGSGLVLTGAGEGWRDLVAGYEALPIEHLGYIPPGDLPLQYRQARALTFFSSYEGFGMPLLEAFHFGTPVACSDIPALVEVGGDAVLTAPPDDPARMAEVMVRIAADNRLRTQLADRGRLRLSHYSFRDSAAALRAAAERVIDRRKSRQRRSHRRLRISVLLDLACPGAELAGGLEALLRQDYGDFEIVPFSGSAPKVLIGDTRLRLSDGDAFASPAAAAAQASGDIRLVVRGDCRLDDAALTRMAAHLDAHLECDVIVVPTQVERAPRVRDRGWRMQLSGARSRLGRGGRRLLETASFERRILRDAASDYRGYRPVVAWRRRIAGLAGSFESTLAYAYDADYHLRLIEAGAAVSILPDPLATIVLSSDPSAARYWYLVMNDLRRIVETRRGRLRCRFFRLYRHRQRGLEPTVTKSWKPLLLLQALAECPIWSAYRFLGKIVDRPTVARIPDPPSAV